MIREISKHDINECVSVIRQSFKTVADTYGFTLENAPKFTAFATTEETLLCQFEDPHRLMRAYYADDRKIIGYFSLLFREDKTCELNNLCVLPSYRHDRVGTALLNDAFSKAIEEKCVRMNIGIVAENTILRKWYEKNGFVYTHSEKFDCFPFTCGYMEKRL